MPPVDAIHLGNRLATIRARLPGGAASHCGTSGTLAVVPVSRVSSRERNPALRAAIGHLCASSATHHHGPQLKKCLASSFVTCESPAGFTAPQCPGGCPSHWHMIYEHRCFSVVSPDQYITPSPEAHLGGGTFNCGAVEKNLVTCQLILISSHNQNALVFIMCHCHVMNTGAFRSCELTNIS